MYRAVVRYRSHRRTTPNGYACEYKVAVFDDSDISVELVSLKDLICIEDQINNFKHDDNWWFMPVARFSFDTDRVVARSSFKWLNVTGVRIDMSELYKRYNCFTDLTNLAYPFIFRNKYLVLRLFYRETWFSAAYDLYGEFLVWWENGGGRFFGDMKIATQIDMLSEV